MENFYYDNDGMVVFTPSISTNKYTYKVYKNNKINSEKTIELNTNTAFVLNDGKYKIVVEEFDLEGNKTILTSEEYVVGNIITSTNNSSDEQIGARVLLICILLIILFLFIRFVETTRKEKRISNFSISSHELETNSILDSIKNFFINLVNNLGNKIKSSAFLTNISKRYQKYADIFDIKDNNPIYIISEKIILGILYLIVIIILKLKTTIMQPYEMIIPFIIGYYILDFYYMYKSIQYRKNLENDMLSAITIMNNAFKSGRSIKQAVELVTKELKGPINKEFKIISKELDYGIDVEMAFKRFSNRIKLDEAIYLTSSLSVLNKTGGNIIEVFSTIERTLLNRKKISIELKSLTSSSRMIMYVLIIIPIVFIAFISIINNGYFKPLFETPLGLALVFIMIFIYIIYIIVVRKVMNVRM